MSEADVKVLVQGTVDKSNEIGQKANDLLGKLMDMPTADVIALKSAVEQTLNWLSDLALQVHLLGRVVNGDFK